MSDHQQVEQKVKDVIQDFYQLMVQVSSYDATNRPSREVLVNGVKMLSSSLQSIHRTASSPVTSLPQIPPELVEYVDNGRNPDIYTREFVELVRRGNQLMRGKALAFAQFRDVLATQIESAMPELRDDVARVMDATGGRDLTDRMAATSGNKGGTGASGGAADGAEGGGGDAGESVGLGLSR